MSRLLSAEIASALGNSSMIRKMFEAGNELRKKYGNDKVYDFSLGNPDVPAPAAVKSALQEIAENADKPFALGYMPNAGYPECRARLAEYLTREQGVPVDGGSVIATCGAAGGINAFFRAVLEPGDEVICPAPYFVEYAFYAGNFQGKLLPVASKADTFELDCDAIAAAITPKTRAVLVNSPNNPTGQIYSRKELETLADVLKAASNKYGRAIYLIADEPYRYLNYDNCEVPSVFSVYDASVVIGSFSKTLSLAGERIGYVAVNPALEGAAELINGLIMTNRILGFVNAPALAQQILIRSVDATIELDIYRRRRNLMAQVLSDAGIEFMMPKGAFYFFPKSPVADERIFVEKLLQERILAVPGRGFGLAGHFRLTFCVDESIIANSAESFKNAMKNL
ncbi:MAG: pyridoxal phosphate-dependent aminotransferase [Lentisphaerae bacterium]|nr:pyridoxal phosphate-dependent aminotransferase [Lentisphaerota bacterium]